MVILEFYMPRIHNISLMFCGADLPQIDVPLWLVNQKFSFSKHVKETNWMEEFFCQGQKPMVIWQ
ncbi:hypothetical protein BDFB_008693 [Asbolus verrucosus]|uniref:Uncharacterized protein n=1 Tax=Asbolus verrucosus TaxID=1661398 RepID=A0A482W7K4_ASBVE|nr:hypothetical protein BDFB_008693 [Asbolus verrucosus]